jgi:hypothetical protein
MGQLFQLAINPLPNSAGSHARKVRLCPASPNGFTDLKAPLPNARLGPRDAILNAPVIHGFAGSPRPSPLPRPAASKRYE